MKLTEFILGHKAIVTHRPIITFFIAVEIPLLEVYLQEYHKHHVCGYLEYSDDDEGDLPLVVVCLGRKNKTLLKHNNDIIVECVVFGALSSYTTRRVGILNKISN